MPDLSHKASAIFWYEYLDPMIYRVITFLESMEEWTLDEDEELEEAITRLGKELDDVEKVDFNKLGEEDSFIRLVGNIQSGRGLRILQAIDSAHPGSASRVLMHAEENSYINEAANFCLKRNIVFERLRLLSRVFSMNRLQMIAKALEGEE